MGRRLEVSISSLLGPTARPIGIEPTLASFPHIVHISLHEHHPRSLPSERFAGVERGGVTVNVERFLIPLFEWREVSFFEGR